jgi:hypothetical protein
MMGYQRFHFEFLLYYAQMIMKNLIHRDYKCVIKMAKAYIKILGFYRILMHWKFKLKKYRCLLV